MSRVNGYFCTWNNTSLELLNSVTIVVRGVGLQQIMPKSFLTLGVTHFPFCRSLFCVSYPKHPCSCFNNTSHNTHDWGQLHVSINYTAHKLSISIHGPLSRYVKLWLAHAPSMPGTFFPPPRVGDPGIHHGTYVTHVPWFMPGSLTSGFLWSRWQGKRSQHSRRMHNPQFYISGKRSIVKFDEFSLLVLWTLVAWDSR